MAAESPAGVWPQPHAQAHTPAWQTKTAERALADSDDYQRTFGVNGLVAQAKQDLIGTRFNPRKPLKLKTRFRGFRILFASVGEPVSVVFEHPGFSSDVCELAA